MMPRAGCARGGWVGPSSPQHQAGGPPLPLFKWQRRLNKPRLRGGVSTRPRQARPGPPIVQPRLPAPRGVFVRSSRHQAAGAAYSPAAAMPARKQTAGKMALAALTLVLGVVACAATEAQWDPSRGGQSGVHNKPIPATAGVCGGTRQATANRRACCRNSRVAVPGGELNHTPR
jgi:hypothetical protein